MSSSEAVLELIDPGIRLARDSTNTIPQPIGRAVSRVSAEGQGPPGIPVLFSEPNERYSDGTSIEKMDK